jgi:hypothetical protein
MLNSTLEVLKGDLLTYTGLQERHPAGCDSHLHRGGPVCCAGALGHQQPRQLQLPLRMLAVCSLQEEMVAGSHLRAGRLSQQTEDTPTCRCAACLTCIEGGEAEVTSRAREGGSG